MKAPLLVCSPVDLGQRRVGRRRLGRAQHPPGRAPSRTAAPWWSSRGQPQPPHAAPGRGGPAGPDGHDAQLGKCVAGQRESKLGVSKAKLVCVFCTVHTQLRHTGGSKQEQPTASSTRHPPGAATQAPPGRKPSGRRQRDELPAGNEPERSSPRWWLQHTAWLLDWRLKVRASLTAPALLPTIVHNNCTTAVIDAGVQKGGAGCTVRLCCCYDPAASPPSSF